MRRRALLVAALVPMTALAVTGCEVEPYCLTCQDGAAGFDGGPDSGGALDGEVVTPDSGPPDSGLPDGCTTDGTELCNERDDDCDGFLDEGFDLQTNPEHCGECERFCLFAHAFAMCEAGGCVLGDCDVGFYDDNGDPSDGCEYNCPGTSEDDSLCNLRDDDCDGAIDEDVDKQNDPVNCGVCGRVCNSPHSMGSCVAGACTLGTCEPGFHDIDGRRENGCEYSCTPADPPTEACNVRDDDCDGTVDEGDPGAGVACGDDTGECAMGTTSCSAGRIVCVGEIRPTTERCNGLDDDCDGNVDEGNPEGGRVCGTSTGLCEIGNEQCMSGALVCVGAVDPVAEECNNIDDDCDGRVDEGNPGGGAACGATTGACEAGAMTCVGGALSCAGGVVARDELCNGADDDCDGSTDEGNPGGGALCGTDVGTCSTGTQQCMSGAQVCIGNVGPSPELCNGQDDDCDGSVDEGNPESGAACGMSTGQCRAGALTCAGGSLSCAGGTGPSDELCNGLDDDCDGMSDEGNPEAGSLCGTDVGTCSTGTRTCMGGSLQCVGDVGPATEACNGLDDDCDGNVDEGNPDGGAACGSSTGRCTQGAMSCVGGGLVCQGGTGPAAEQCNTQDDDCDGSTDEDFSLMSDTRNCGACGNVCSLPNATPACSSGACVVASCDEGFVDLDPGAPGCEYACSFAGQEVCNGRDDDCDGVTDESVSVPSGFCNPNGVCAGTTATCSGASGFVCTYDSSFEETETSCDSLDNDCDGFVDEAYPLVGTSCSNGIGQCRRNGSYECNGAQDGIVCNAPAAGVEADEECNALDDDCDGSVDERVADDPGTPWRDGVDVNAIDTVTVDLGGATIQVMAYEASRPDATSSSAGQNTALACSRPDVKPWTHVTWDQAQTACCALNESGTCPGAGASGWRLCDAPDWQTACEGPTGSCQWSYGTMCAMSQTTECNGAEFDCNPGVAGNQDCLYTTGSSQFPMCFTDWAASGSVYDMSGNVREWTATSRGSDVFEVRGGSYNHIEAGRACSWDFTVAQRTTAAANTGFRCCLY